MKTMSMGGEDWLTTGKWKNRQTLSLFLVHKRIPRPGNPNPVCTVLLSASTKQRENIDCTRCRRRRRRRRCFHYHRTRYCRHLNRSGNENDDASEC